MSLRTIALVGIAFATLQTAHAATSHAFKRHAAHPHAAPATDRTIALTSLGWLKAATPLAVAARPDLQAAAAALLSPAEAPIPPHAR